MELSLDDACISLGNTTNKFHALQHSQFVENRVCEEDEIMTHLPTEVKVIIIMTSKYLKTCKP